MRKTPSIHHTRSVFFFGWGNEFYDSETDWSSPRWLLPVYMCATRAPYVALRIRSTCLSICNVIAGAHAPHPLRCATRYQLYIHENAIEKRRTRWLCSNKVKWWNKRSRRKSISSGLCSRGEEALGERVDLFAREPPCLARPMGRQWLGVCWSLISFSLSIHKEKTSHLLAGSYTFSSSLPIFISFLSSSFFAHHSCCFTV